MEMSSYRESVFVQIEKYVADHDFEKPIVDETLVGSDDEQEVLHKTSTQHYQDNHHKIRSDQQWIYLNAKSSTNCEQMTKLISYLYSIPCSNAFTDGVFSHMKHAWTLSRNSMSTETVVVELQIRSNCKMKCNDLFYYICSK